MMNKNGSFNIFEMKRFNLKRIYQQLIIQIKLSNNSKQNIKVFYVVLVDGSAHYIGYWKFDSMRIFVS